MKYNAINNYSIMKRKKEIIGIILFATINILVAYAITSYVGIANTVIYHSFCVTIGDITLEVVILMALAFIEAFFYDYVL